MSSDFFYKAGYGRQCRWDAPISNGTILTLFCQRITHWLRLEGISGNHLKQSHLDLVVQTHVQMAFEYF